jgi:hypothetical protein
MSSVFRRRYPLFMAIPELIRRRAEQLLQQLIDRRVPTHVRNEIRMSVETRGNNVTLFEHRPVWRMPDQWTNGKVAQFRYDSDANRWTLYWSDRHGRWLRNEPKRQADDIATLIHEVDKDPAGAFWG